MNSEKAVCQVCASADISAQFIVQGIQVKKCAQCGLVFVHPLPEEKELRAGYQQQYFQSADPLSWGYENYLLMDKENRQTAARRLHIVEELIKSGSLLEIGCATGIFLQEAGKHGFQLTGIEISEFAGRIGREKYQVPIITGTLPEAGLPENNYDLVAMWDMLEHVPNPVAELAAAAKVLKGGGYLFLTVPDTGTLAARLLGKKWFGFSKIREHLYYFNKKSIELALHKTGFEVLQIRSSPMLVSWGFLAGKLARYSKSLSRALAVFLKIFKLMDKTLNFKYIDMLVVARKI